MRGKALIGWVVDVQRDLMAPDGRFYIRDTGDGRDPGAIAALPAIEDTVEWMRTHCDVMVFTGAWHDGEDEEIDSDDPDPARGTYPPHCLGRSDDPSEREGALIVESVRPANPVVLAVEADAGRAVVVARLAVEESRPIFIQKSRFDVFEGNRAAEELVRSLEDTLDRDLEIYVAGVSRDIGVTAVVDGLAQRGYEVVALRDAMWGLGLESEHVTLMRWGAAARVARTADLDP